MAFPAHHMAMKFFLDTADINEISQWVTTGLVDGVTTNPTLIAKAGGNFLEMIAQICDLVEGPVSAEVASTDFETMLAEGEKLASIAENVVVKVPLTVAGLQACNVLSQQGIPVNVTLCFSAAQALLAAKSGATYVSPFIGRLDDIGKNGLELIGEIVQVFANYPEYETQILAASIRSVEHVVACAKLGADVVTMPVKILPLLYNHELTDKGLATFVDDWAKTGQKIL